MHTPNRIEAIFLDVGNTLRVLEKDPDWQARARRQFAALVGTSESPDVLFERLDRRWKYYRAWSFENVSEACEADLWTHFMLPELAPDKIGPLAGKLTRLWRDKDGRRVPRHDVKSTVAELSRRGYCLGIISNTIAETEIPDWLESDHLNGYFKAVILSARVRYRKPGPEIYMEGVRQVGIPPERCAYVGDNPARDVVGTRRAGFGMVLLLMQPEGLANDPPSGENTPDRIIHSFGELLGIFPDQRSRR